MNGVSVTPVACVYMYLKSLHIIFALTSQIIDTGGHCCTQLRRRSKASCQSLFHDTLCKSREFHKVSQLYIFTILWFQSAGAEITTDKLVHHARPALVLQKPAFVPVKPKHHKITPCAFELSTERRAKEREQFEAELRCKEQERAHALNEVCK